MGVLASSIFPGAFWSRGQNVVDQISLFREVARHSGLYEFHSCTLRPEVSHCEFFGKIPSLPLVLRWHSFSHYPRIATTCADRNKDRFINWQLCSVRKLPFYYHRAMKLTQNCICFTNPCINLFVLPWIPFQGTWTSLPAALPLTCSTHRLGFLERYSISVLLMPNSRITRTHIFIFQWYRKSWQRRNTTFSYGKDFVLNFIMSAVPRTNCASNSTSSHKRV